MYQNLLYGIKRKMLDEVENAFINHPAFTDKVKVYHKFPYDERIQYGALLRNTSASQIRLSADNYMADKISHVRLAHDTPHKISDTEWAANQGNGIEWVRENAGYVTELVKDEDVSHLLDPTQRLFHTSYEMLSGKDNTEYATNVGQVSVTINGVQEFPEFINGEQKVVVLRRAPPAGAMVLISYYKRAIAAPGLYVIDFIEDNQFLVAPIYVVDKELVVENTTGTEVTVALANGNVYPSSDYVILKYKNSTNFNALTRGTDYTVDYTTGVITFLNPIPKNYQLKVSYRWQPLNYNNGPYDFKIYQENHEVVPGVVISIGRRAKKGDRQIVIVSKKREQQAQIYGGHWDMSMEFSVIAKDPIQTEEMSDQLVSYLWGIRKNALEFEGITLNTVEPSGESEESFIESTGDVYYTTGVNISLMSEWQAFVPYLYEIRDIMPNIYPWPGTKEYIVNSNGSLSLGPIKTNTDIVMLYPTVGYERLS